MYLYIGIKRNVLFQISTFRIEKIHCFCFAQLKPQYMVQIKSLGYWIIWLPSDGLSMNILTNLSAHHFLTFICYFVAAHPKFESLTLIKRKADSEMSTSNCLLLLPFCRIYQSFLRNIIGLMFVVPVEVHASTFVQSIFFAKCSLCILSFFHSFSFQIKFCENSHLCKDIFIFIFYTKLNI